MEEDKKLRAYIIKNIVDRFCYNKDELNGINEFLDYLDKNTLEEITKDLEIDYK